MDYEIEQIKKIGVNELEFLEHSFNLSQTEEEAENILEEIRLVVENDK